MFEEVKYFSVYRGHQAPADPRDHHLRGHPGDGDPDGGSPLPEGETQAVQGQGAGALVRPARPHQGRQHDNEEVNLCLFKRIFVELVESNMTKIPVKRNFFGSQIITKRRRTVVTHISQEIPYGG